LVGVSGTRTKNGQLQGEALGNIAPAYRRRAGQWLESPSEFGEPLPESPPPG
jgi:hypothetical protein